MATLAISPGRDLEEDDATAVVGHVDVRAYGELLDDDHPGLDLIGRPPATKVYVRSTDAEACAPPRSSTSAASRRRPERRPCATGITVRPVLVGCLRQ